MKVNNDLHKPNFKGYSNLITNCHKNNDGGIFTYLSMQLNDIGQPDLSEFKKLKEFNNNSDVIMLSFSRYNKEYPGDFLVNDIPIPNSESLRNLRAIVEAGEKSNHFIDLDGLEQFKNIFKFSKLTTEEFKNNEKSVLKLYTLIASLTKRISNENAPITNKNLKNVLAQTLSYLSTIVQSKADAYASLSDAMLNIIPVQKVAKLMNTEVSKTMMKYFK